MKFKVGGLTPEEDARALPRRARRRPGRTSCSAPTPTRRGRRARRSASRGSSRTRPALVRGAVPLVERPARDARRALRGGVRVCAGQSEFSAGGLPRPDGRRRDRRLQLRRVLVGRPDRVAARRRGRRSPSTSRWATTRSRRSPRTCSRSIPHGTFVECFHPDRDPIWWNLIANRPPIVDGQDRRSRPAPGLGWELDGDYIEAYRVESRRVTEPLALARSRQGLDGRGVLVTGAAGGIGRRSLAPSPLSGARVAAVDLSRRTRPPSSPPRCPATGMSGLAPTSRTSIGQTALIARGRGGSRAARRACPPGGRAAPPHDDRRGQRGRLGRPDRRQPQGDVLPQPGVRRAVARGGRARARSSTSARRAGGPAASAARSSTTPRRAASSR